MLVGINEEIFDELFSIYDWIGSMKVSYPSWSDYYWSLRKITLDDKTEKLQKFCKQK